MDDIERWIMAGRDKTLEEFLDWEASELREAEEKKARRKAEEEALREQRNASWRGVSFDARQQPRPFNPEIVESERVRLAQFPPSSLCAFCNVRADQHLAVAHSFIERKPNA